MNPIFNNLKFQESLKKTYLNNKNSDELSYQELSNKENQVLFGLRLNPQQAANHNKSYGQLVNLNNRNTSTFKYYTDSQFPNNRVEISPGVPASKIEKNNEILEKEFRNSCRQLPTTALNVGYMGLGSSQGNIDISSQLRNNIETNVHKTQKPSINNFTDWTFQILDPQVVSNLAPDGLNGNQSFDVYGDISRY